MSYRIFKRLLGESSLERKCRFLFGGGLLILISLSFYLYSKLASGMVNARFPAAPTEKVLAFNFAMLLTTAIVTTFIAMVATFAIARFVIVNPVLHLKKGRDAISRGDFDHRADIRTGDEFDELAQAFNRMLRRLLAEWNKDARDH